MKRIELDAYAKINLSLDVLKKRKDGYHEVEMIMQQIGLKDKIILEKIDTGIELTCNDKRVPTDSTNLVYKAYNLLKERYSINEGIKIHIEKNIPIAAGLAGGSSDAAQTLIGLNELWNLGLSKEELMEIGLEIGADIPYCIMGSTALSCGIGEKLTKLQNFKGKIILLAKPDIDVSTAYVYGNLDIENIKNHPMTKDLIHSITIDDVKFLAGNMKNVLENVTIKKYSIIEKIKKQMMDYGALGSLMSGSGPTVFAIFDDYKKAEKCKELLEQNIDEVYLTKTI